MKSIGSDGFTEKSIIIILEVLTSKIRSKNKVNTVRGLKEWRKERGREKLGRKEET